MAPNDLQLVSRAISFAARQHLGQFRKDGRTPYIAHPLRVLTVAATLFGVDDAEVLAAAVLHDTIEDTTTDRDDLIEQFSPRVAQWVSQLSKDKRLPETERERVYFESLATAPVEVKLCKLADVYDNLTDSLGLSADERRKKIVLARQLAEILAPGFPTRWQAALDHVQRQIETVGESL